MVEGISAAAPEWTPVTHTTEGEVGIAYQLAGPSDGVPLLLVAGLGAQMLYWHDELCAMFLQRGFSVARFDNRDVGMSDHTVGRSPGRIRAVLQPKSVARYGLDEMAGDAIAVLDALGWHRAVVMGCSQGGAIAQVVASRWPARVCGLVSVMSTPSLRVGRGSLTALSSLVRRAPTSAVEAGEAHISLYRTIGSPGFAHDEEWLRAVGTQQFQRSDDAVGRLFQLAAMMSSSDRRGALATVDAPTLVIHGEADPVFRLRAGQATAESIPGSRFVSYPGMGHDLPRELWPAIVDEVATLAGLG